MIKLDMERDVRNILEDVLKSQKIEIKKQDRIGGDSTVFDVTKGSKEYILRVGGNRKNYDVEHQVMRLAREKGVLVASPLAESIDTSVYPLIFSLQERLPGAGLGRLPEKDWPGVLLEVGRNLKGLYEIRIPGYGGLDLKEYRKTGKLKGEFEKWSAYFDYMLKSHFTGEVEKRLNEDRASGFKDSKLSATEADKVTEIVSRVGEIGERLNSAAPLMDKVDGRLIHHDISFEHILVDKGKFSGLIDFNHAASGDPLYDIAYFSVMQEGDLYKYLMEGTGVNMNEELFSFYRLITAAAKIHTRYVRHNYLHENPEILDIALGELNSK